MYLLISKTTLPIVSPYIKIIINNLYWTYDNLFHKQITDILHNCHSSKCVI